MLAHVVSHAASTRHCCSPVMSPRDSATNVDSVCAHTGDDSADTCSSSAELHISLLCRSCARLVVVLGSR
eukprot:4057721-Amphidinium_carterae.1